METVVGHQVEISFQLHDTDTEDTSDYPDRFELVQQLNPGRIRLGLNPFCSGTQNELGKVWIRSAVTGLEALSSILRAEAYTFFSSSVHCGSSRRQAKISRADSS